MVNAQYAHLNSYYEYHEFNQQQNYLWMHTIYDYQSH
jgi:hypothetical protein